MSTSSNDPNNVQQLESQVVKGGTKSGEMSKLTLTAIGVLFVAVVILAIVLIASPASGDKKGSLK